jgi:hypothetical protein
VDANTDLDDVFAALNERAQSEPRLERYRVVGNGSRGLDGVPADWFVSDAIARIASDGGWWPGAWHFPVDDDIVTLVLTGNEEPRPEAGVRWLGVGSVWERDGFWTPALRERRKSAPLFGFSSQALWSSMVFPTEVALLEAFVVTYDELGFDDHGMVNPFFVEWVTQSPSESEGEGADRVHQRLMELSQQWTSEHQCWVPDAMPRMDDQIWPADIVAAILGTDRAS